MSIDLLVFGPHPDDIEIGLGGTVARHTAAGDQVGLCDLTRGELSSNGTPEQRQVEAAAAARVLGALWRENLGWPDGGIEATPPMIRAAAGIIRRHRPRAIAIPHWEDRHPDHVAASHVLRTAAFRSGLRRYDAAEPWRPDWPVITINDSTTPLRRRDVSSTTASGRRLLPQPVCAFAKKARCRQPDGGIVPAADREPRRAVRRAGRRAFAEGIVVREPVQRPGLLKHAR
jgi:bacillithiol biosynthesis deacetylase BshB1